MKTKWIIVISFLLIGNTSLLFGHTIFRTYGITLGADALFNQRGIGISPDLNVTYIIFNIGSSINTFREYPPSYNLYFGLGAINIFQFQLGTNFKDKRLRFRMILPILTETHSLWPSELLKNYKWYERINLQLHYEKNITNPVLSNLAIGLSFLIL